MKYLRILIALVAAAFACPLQAIAETEKEILDLNLEDLMAIEISSVSKQEQPLFTTAASVSVLSQEDIRRSGVNSIPDLLRLVPGVHVARIINHIYAISIRGFSDQFANKLLVLVDGRSIYTPLFGGVFWDMHDLVFEDINQVEVIRGPGASVWGANAVNGVINIITKHTKDTQGGLLSAGGGTEDQGFSTLRYGGTIMPGLTGRMFGKFISRDDSETTSGEGAKDGWDIGTGGMRLDWEGSAGHRALFDLSIFHENQDSSIELPGIMTGGIVPQDNLVRGGHALGRWEYGASNDGGRLQFFYNRQDREFGDFNEVRDTYDLDFQHSIPLTSSQQVTAGVGFRSTDDTTTSSDFLRFVPTSRRDKLLSAFLQDTISLVPKKLSLTIGSKIEQNDYTGTEVQPSARLMWTPHQKHVFWTSFSRATRTPTRSEEDVSLAASQGITEEGIPFVATVNGSDDLSAEEILATEVGYRYALAKSTMIDLSLFCNRYDNLLTVEPGDPTIDTSTGSPLIIIDNKFVGLGNAHVYGGEIIIDSKLTPWWRLYSGVSFTKLDVSTDASSRDPSFRGDEKKTPRVIATARSLITLTPELEFDTTLRYADSARVANAEAYTELDLRLGWHLSDSVELSAVGQNLLHDSHQEFSGTFIAYPQTEVERSVLGKITVKF